ncbi:hypothetical protein C7451_105200 [Blastomonas natatoria]|uniref:Alpha/beta hydrolase n=1 Tax=Blastomonas natatoria TaxID=34015 RepID=A0A2V3V3V4_9SPHN|nr:hypothetical protein [Blastomonas natatoria]PXW76426.1 hypothetical protein C7451_105200 [Blastomonas natatoria]
MSLLRSLPVLLVLALALCHERAAAHAAGPVILQTVLEHDMVADHEVASGSMQAPQAPRAAIPALAAFGPFRVTGPATADMIGLVDSGTPDDFAAMLEAFPGIATLCMIECPGSEDDEANLKLARMLRKAGIETLVPAGGSVRSGAVELFLAGVKRRADSKAEFAVHSWRDELGREARDLPSDDPVHREYLDFYREMGLSEDSAARFYALTNSVSFDDAVMLAPLQLAAMGLLEML